MPGYAVAGFGASGAAKGVAVAAFAVVTLAGVAGGFGLVREEQPGTGATSARTTMAQRVVRKWRLMVIGNASMMIRRAGVNP
jgi:hypothetical protein